LVASEDPHKPTSITLGDGLFLSFFSAFSVFHSLLVNLTGSDFFFTFLLSGSFIVISPFKTVLMNRIINRYEANKLAAASKKNSNYNLNGPVINDLSIVGIYCPIFDVVDIFAGKDTTVLFVVVIRFFVSSIFF
jgi:hypothetical protein